MTLIHSDQTFTLDGVNDFTVGGTTISWGGGGFIGDLDIFSDDPAPASYTVTATLTGSNWGIGRFASSGDQGAGTVVRAIINDDTSGSNRFIELLGLYGTGGNVLTLNHTEVGTIAGSDHGDDTVTSNTTWVGSIQLFGGNDSVTVTTGSVDNVNLGQGNNTFASTGGYVSALTAYDGNDTANIGGDTGAVDLGNGNNTVTITAGYVGSINLGDGNDTVTTTAGYVGSIILGGGNNTVTTQGDVSAIVAFNGNDFAMTGAGFVNSINLGQGNNTIITGSASVSSIVTYSGNDTVVTNGGENGGAGMIDMGQGKNVITLHGFAGMIHAGAGNDTYNLTSFDPIIRDGGGIDTVTTTISRDLGHRSFPAIENLTLLGAGAISGRGNELNNIITGNNKANTLVGADGRDTLFGLGGNDTLVGGAGRDTMTGGLGNDIFRYDGVGQSPRGVGADVIKDFDDFGNDRIDLRSVFGGVMHYIGTAAFSAAGQVRISDAAGPDVVVQVNTFGTSVADMEIRLSHTTLGSMNAGDFFL